MNPVMKSIIKAKLQNMGPDDLVAFCQSNGFTLKKTDAVVILKTIAQHDYKIFSETEQQSILHELRPHINSEAAQWIKQFLLDVQ